MKQQLLQWNMAYEGADNMNSLKHLGLPLMAVGQMEGEELHLRRNSLLRKIYLQDNRIIGFGMGLIEESARAALPLT